MADTQPLNLVKPAPFQAMPNSFRDPIHIFETCLLRDISTASFKHSRAWRLSVSAAGSPNGATLIPAEPEDTEFKPQLFGILCFSPETSPGK